MVDIKTSKVIEPKIYAYTTPTVTDNEGWIKIGYTEREVEKRIREQTHTANIRADILWTGEATYTEDPDKGEAFKDHDFHHFLSYHDIERRPKTEWFYFNGTPDQSKILFDKFVKHDTSGYQPGQGQDYTLRQEQEEAVVQTLTYLKDNPGGKFLWNAKPRFGKTLATYDLVCRMQATNVLIVTNRPTIANSWYDDFDRFIASKTSYKFVSETDALKDRPTLSHQDFQAYLRQNLDKVADIGRIAFISLQDLKGSVFLGGQYDKLKWVTETPWDILVIDEAHEGVDTLKTDTAFDKITRRFTLHLSGTPFKALAKGDFTAEQIFNWSYADEQKAKQDWLPSAEEENPYEALPQLNMFTYQMSHMIVDQLEDGVQLEGENVDYAFDLNEFFATKDNGRFYHEEAVKAWLNTLTTNEKYPFSTKELRNELKHTFWLLDRVASAKALKALLEDHPIYENYEIVLAAGDGKSADGQDDKNNLKALDKVRKAIKEHDKTITLSVGQLTTGVTIPEWTGVLMLSNIKSPSLYMQAAFRAQNPYSWTDHSGQHYRKERAYVFDFAPERTLILFDEFANNLSLATATGGGTTANREENIRELLNFFPVIAEDQEGKMVEIDAKQVLTIPRQIKAAEVLKRGFMSNLLFDNIAGIFQATQTVLDILSELPVEKEGKAVQTESLLTVDDVTVDDEGNALVDAELVINQQTKLFGEKIYRLGETVTTLVGSMEDKPQPSQTRELGEQVSETILDELVAEYQLNAKESKTIAKQIQDSIDHQVKRNTLERTIAEAHIRDEYAKQLKETDDANLKQELAEDFAKKLEENQVHYNEQLVKDLKQEVEAMPEKFIEQVEIKRVEQLKATAQDEIRGHLRGFARTIPSFIMAYGDSDLNLDNFDTYVPEHVFKEVTGITIDQFRYLRDGGEGFVGHLFDKPTFDEAIQEFLRKKLELANYFEQTKEDIFDYIPPQRTNQIFTPKRVVIKMVDDLEKENPTIFDDPTKTFIDLYMKSGLYIAEIVKRLYNSQGLATAFPDTGERLKHILEHQVFGFAPTEIIYNIATNFIFGQLPETISRSNFVLEDTVPAAKEGRIQELVDKHFG